MFFYSFSLFLFFAIFLLFHSFVCTDSYIFYTSWKWIHSFINSFIQVVWIFGGWRTTAITRLLSLLAVCIRAGGVEDFQGPGRRADGALASVTHLRHWRRDGVTVEEPELGEERRGEGEEHRQPGRRAHWIYSCIGVTRVILGQLMCF